MTMNDCPDYIRLEKCEQEENKFRFYVMYVAENLFGEWSLVREWGRIGQAGQMRIDWCGSLEDARGRLAKKHKEKLRRGYV